MDMDMVMDLSRVEMLKLWRRNAWQRTIADNELPLAVDLIFPFSPKLVQKNYQNDGRPTNFVCQIKRMLVTDWTEF